jgi:hypothetical protein
MRILMVEDDRKVAEFVEERAGLLQKVGWSSQRQQQGHAARMGDSRRQLCIGALAGGRPWLCRDLRCGSRRKRGRT